LENELLHGEVEGQNILCLWSIENLADLMVLVNRHLLQALSGTATHLSVAYHRVAGCWLILAVHNDLLVVVIIVACSTKLDSLLC
jgi:hypothetical protein